MADQRTRELARAAHDDPIAMARLAAETCRSLGEHVPQLTLHASGTEVPAAHTFGPWYSGAKVRIVRRFVTNLSDRMVPMLFALGAKPARSFVSLNGGVSSDQSEESAMRQRMPLLSTATEAGAAVPFRIDISMPPAFAAAATTPPRPLPEKARVAFLVVLEVTAEGGSCLRCGGLVG